MFMVLVKCTTDRIKLIGCLMILLMVMLLGAPELRCVNEEYVGSAVAVSLEDGGRWALTAKHCIKKPKGKIELHCFENGVYHTFKARLYCVSESHDVCLLEVLSCDTDCEWKTVELADIDYVYKKGSVVESWGCANGRDPDKRIHKVVKELDNIILDTENTIGRSGGPLYNAEGKLIGIASTSTVGSWVVDDVVLPHSCDYVSVKGIWSLFQ